MDRYRKQEWNNVYKRKWPVILAMQGDPYTGKTKLANHLAGWLNYPILRLEDFVDTLSPNCPQNPETIFFQAFDLLTRVVKTHTSTGFSVIVDSPLSRLSHLDKLVSLLNVVSLDEGSIDLSLLVIECKPSITYMSEMKFMERDPETSNKWYKPQKWPPDLRFIGRDYTDDSMHPMVSKLAVDTCKNFQIGDMRAAVHDLTAGPEDYRVELHKWKYTHGYNPHLIRQRSTSLSSDQNKELCCLRGHSVSIYNEEGMIHCKASSCGVCQGRSIADSLNGGVYNCRCCPLTIHKSCAEAGSGIVYFTPQNFPKFIRTQPAAACCFPKEQACLVCKRKRLKFSYKCHSCIFECHMKSRMLPTVRRHEGHPHWLFFNPRPVSRRIFELCDACYRTMDCSAYLCSRRIDDRCNVAYHPQCLLLPPFMRGHQHCGYTHDLELKLCRDEEFDDYPCHLCFKFMHPAAWYYRCKECCLDLHLDCAFKNLNNFIYSFIRDILGYLFI